MPTLQRWANRFLVSVHPSGSFMKGTAILSGTDIDLFISLSEDTTESLEQIYESLFNRLSEDGYSPTRQNVSLNIKVHGYSVDLVPAKRQNPYSQDHSIYVRRARTWQKTNVITHIETVRGANRLQETRVTEALAESERA